MLDVRQLQVRLRLLYLTVKVIRTPSMAKHSGFGIVDTGADSSADVASYELFHCTTLAKFKEMLVHDLGLPSPDHLRLWVFTQPWPDTVLCPREILVNEPVAQHPPAPDTADDDLNSPTLFSLLQLHMDGLGVARVWAECSSDGGFYSEESGPAPLLPLGLPIMPDRSGPGAPFSFHPVPAAGGAAMEHIPGMFRGQPHHVLPTVPLWPDARDASSQQALQQQQQAQQQQAAGAGAGAVGVPGDLHALVFIKWLDPMSGTIRYLTHAVLRMGLPLHHLFNLVATVVHQPAQLLAAHVETTPANWQPGSVTLHRLITCPGAGVGAEQGQAQGQTIRDANIENGQILTFHLGSM
jgi:hypothetical protein